MNTRWICVLLLAAAAVAAERPVDLYVDASDAPRRIFHARMTLPAAPGPLRLVYPKWIPGEHGPTGPIADLVSLRVAAAGRPLEWRRDPMDMYAFLIDVPAGVSSIEVSYDFLSPPKSEGFTSGASATTEMAVLSWNQLVLYPEGAPAGGVEYRAKLRVPAGWRYGSALPIARESGDEIEFRTVPLTTLIDSPVIAGRYFRTIELTPGSEPRHYLHLAADSAAALEVTPRVIENYKQLVAETGAVFGARHYRSYHFLVSLSDHVAHFGLEHHESSDNRIPELAMTDEDLRKVHAGLLPHEMAHSWNGKYRRPSGLATEDYQKPMLGELLWVYEGLTTYLGEILTPRSGLRTPEEFRQDLALTAAALDNSPGRQWRPLADTAVAAQVLYRSRSDWQSLRRGVDFYPEGVLIWLEADVIIRRESRGRKSLDDFCRRFFGGASGGPEVKPYTLDDVVAELNAVQPYDWRGFFDERVNRPSAHAPLGGIAGAGWRLAYREVRPAFVELLEEQGKYVDARFSLGLLLSEEGAITDVLGGSPADRAGVAPAGKVLAVNGRQFTEKVLRAALREAKEGSEPIELIVKDGERYKTHRVECRMGECYPVLERDEAQPDLLSDIIRSQAGG